MTDTSNTSVPAAPLWGPVVFVWTVWTGMLGGVFAFILRYSQAAVPRLDEWSHVGASMTPTWLWEQHQEHRLPLAKFIWLGVLQLTDYDFLVGNVLLAAALAGMAAALIVGARRLRGRTAYTDAFFPLAVLNFGQGQTFAWWWQVNSILAPLTATAFLLLVVRHGRAPALRHVVTAGVCLVLLPFCGPGGLPYALVLALWLPFWSWPDRRAVLAGSGFAAAALAAVALYFVGWTETASEARNFELLFGKPDLSRIALTSLLILALGLGTATHTAWQFWGGFVLVLGAASVILVAYQAARDAAERTRAVGLALFLGTSAALVWRVAQARAVLGADYIYSSGHYLTMVIPAICCVYFVWELYSPSFARGLVPLCLFAATVLQFDKTVAFAVHLASAKQEADRQFQDDLLAGMPLFLLAERHGEYLTGSDSLAVAQALLRQARQARVGIFRRMGPDPDLVEEAVPIVSATLNQVVWQDDIAEGSGTAEAPATFTFTLEQPRPVYAIRVGFAFEMPPEDTAHMTLLYGRYSEVPPGTLPQQDAGVSVVPLPASRDVHRRTFLVNRRIDHFELVPSVQPFRLRLTEIVLLMPRRAESTGEPQAIRLKRSPEAPR